MDKQRALVIIPTWNEAKNIEPLLKEIVRSYPQMDVVVVDAQSQDGTPQIVRALSREFPQIHLLEQAEPGKFGEALKNRVQICFGRWLRSDHNHGW